MQFVYDGLGRCVKRTINGVAVVYVYDGWKPIFEHAWDNSWFAWNIYGSGQDEILWRYQSNVGHLRYHTDIHGNVTELLGWGTEGLEKYTYDAFGQPTITDWSGNPHVDGNNQPQSWYGNRFMFTGREYLSQLGIYDYRHRMYQPSLGRFLQTDPKGFDAGDMNLFRYCADDPVDRTDPLGLEDFVRSGAQPAPGAGPLQQQTNPVERFIREMNGYRIDASAVEAMAIKATQKANEMTGKDGLPVAIGVLGDTSNNLTLSDPAVGKPTSDDKGKIVRFEERISSIGGKAINWAVYRLLAIGHSHPATMPGGQNVL